MLTNSAAILILSSFVSAEVSMFRQCGGTNFRGETNCVSGASCVARNEFYSQCLPTANGEAEACGIQTTAQAVIGNTAAASLATSATSPAAGTTVHSHTHVSAAATTAGTTSTQHTSASVTPAAANDVVPATLNAATSATPVLTRNTEAAVSDSVTPSTLSTVYRSTAASSALPAASSSADYHSISGGLTGSSTTTRYWDCCKPSCGWPGKSTHLTHTVNSCDINGNVLSDNNIQSGCEDDGSAFMCNDQTPWVVSDTLAYGFAAAAVAGASEETICCSCMKLTFQDQLVGKEMIVQITNTGSDMVDTNFDIALPGGGVGLMDKGCTAEFGDNYTWGQQDGGVSSLDACSGLPSPLQPGCQFRFDDWFAGADNPHVTYEQVSCPASIIERSGCGRTDE